MKCETRKRDSRLPVAGMLFTFLLVSAIAFAQDTTTKQTFQSGAATITTEVKSAEVIYVSGNDLVVRTEDGQIKHLVVPDSTRATVDGTELSVHELTPGMHLTRTITTTTVPKTVRTIRTIQGTVWHVNAPGTVILTLPDNTNKEYRVPKNQVFMIGGEKHDVFDLRKGMKVSATVISDFPFMISNAKRAVTGEAPPPPETPAEQGALLIEDPAPATAPELAQATLPKTGSLLPLTGLLGLMFVGIACTVQKLRSN